MTTHSRGIPTAWEALLFLAGAVTAAVKNPVAWMIVGFVATLVYLVVITGQFTLADARGR